MKKECPAFIAKISESGKDGDEPNLYDKPEFYKQMHEIERRNSRYDPAAVIFSENTSIVSDLSLTSTHKKAMNSHMTLMETFS